MSSTLKSSSNLLPHLIYLCFKHQMGFVKCLDEPGATDLFKWPGTCGAGPCGCTTRGDSLTKLWVSYIAEATAVQDGWWVSVCRCSLQQAHWTVPGDNRTQDLVGGSRTVVDCLHECICQRRYWTNQYCSPQLVTCALERASDAQAVL